MQSLGADAPDALIPLLKIGGVDAVPVLSGGDDRSDALLKPRLVQLVGRAVADADGTPRLLGVAPETQVVVPDQPREGDANRQPLASGLTYLLLTPGADWG